MNDANLFGYKYANLYNELYELHKFFTIGKNIATGCYVSIWNESFANEIKEEIMGDTLYPYIPYTNSSVEILKSKEVREYDNDDELIDNGYSEWSESEASDIIWALHHSVDNCNAYIHHHVIYECDANMEYKSNILPDPPAEIFLDTDDLPF